MNRSNEIQARLSKRVQAILDEKENFLRALKVDKITLPLPPEKQTEAYWVGPLFADYTDKVLRRNLLLIKDAIIEAMAEELADVTR